MRFFGCLLSNLLTAIELREVIGNAQVVARISPRTSRGHVRLWDVVSRVEHSHRVRERHIFVNTAGMVDQA
jgi:hypothetical protein